MVCDIQIQFDDHVSVYRIDQETIESILRMGDLDEISDTIFMNGAIVESIEGDVFLDLTGFDLDNALGDFQNGLFEFFNDMEQEALSGAAE